MEKFSKQIKLQFLKTGELPEQVISCSKDANEAFRLIMNDIDIYESVTIIYFNNKKKVIGWTNHSKGGITSSIVDVRTVMAAGLNCLATGFMICHNHPSGALNPSNSDREITKKLKEAGDIMDIRLVDHLIITEDNNAYFSFADEGLL